MTGISKVLDLVVNNDLCVGCGLCIYKCPAKAIDMQWSDSGFLVPVQSGACNEDGFCLAVCPFSPYPEKEVETENALANIYLKDASLSHRKIGRYSGIYAGYSDEFRLTSSSGGIATFIFTDLMVRGIVSHIFSVKESKTPGVHYEYVISNNKEELLGTSKTKYYPVTLASVFSKLSELEGKVAVSGVACFIKAIRLAQYDDHELREKIPFLVGIICGGVKSRFYTEYLAEKAGVPKENCINPNYRIKDLCSTASDYSFGCQDKRDKQERVLKMKEVGDMWGTGLFKANACDFCDDVTTELADVSLGDAWLQPFVQDGLGNNIIVTRSKLAEKIISEGIDAKKLIVEGLSMDKLIASQQGSFNHRHKGMPYRIKKIKKEGKLIPPKRYDNGGLLGVDFKLVQFFRVYNRRKSLEIWKTSPNAHLFDKKMRYGLFLLNVTTRIYHFGRAFKNKFDRK